MLLPVALALGGTVAVAAASPNRVQRREIASFPAGTSWDIVLNKENVDLDGLMSTSSAAVSAMDIDLFDNEASTVSTLKSQNKQVICYFSAGSREDWRDDAGKFNADDYGKGLDGWKGENWVNVKSDNVRKIMKERIAIAAQKGCTAIDPDNTDGYNENQDGFGYDKSAYAEYIKFLASEASSQGMAIGLKNSIDLIPDVIDVIQFAVNEQCHQYKECDKYKQLTDVDKAVFNVEYGGKTCESPAGVNLSILNKPEDQGLNTLGGACAPSGGQGAEQPAEAGATPAPAEPVATKPVVGIGKGQTTLATVASPTGTAVSVQPTPAGSNNNPNTDNNDENNDSDDEDDEEEEEAEREEDEEDEADENEDNEDDEDEEDEEDEDEEDKEDEEEQHRGRWGQ